MELRYYEKDNIFYLYDIPIFEYERVVENRYFNIKLLLNIKTLKKYEHLPCVEVINNNHETKYFKCKEFRIIFLDYIDSRKEYKCDQLLCEMLGGDHNHISKVKINDTMVNYKWISIIDDSQSLILTRPIRNYFSVPLFILDNLNLEPKTEEEYNNLIMNLNNADISLYLSNSVRHITIIENPKIESSIKLI